MLNIKNVETQQAVFNLQYIIYNKSIFKLLTKINEMSLTLSLHRDYAFMFTLV